MAIETRQNLTVLYIPIEIAREAIMEDVESANRDGDRLPEPLVIWADPDNKNKVIINHPEGYNLRPFEEKIKAKIYGTTAQEFK